MLWLLLLQVEGGHDAIKKLAVELRDGMLIVGLLGESGKLLLTNDGSKKASVTNSALTPSNQKSDPQCS